MAWPCHSTGSCGCAAAAGAVVGTATGATIASSANGALRAGVMAVNKNGQACGLSGNTGFQSAFGANGVHDTVVTAP